MTNRERRATGRDVRSQQRLVTAWTHPVGTLVDVRKDNGDVLRATTSSKAELLCGHTAVIWLDGITGCYDLSRVTVVEK